jgi:galactokinase
MDQRTNELVAHFEKIYAAKPRAMVRAPGRVNLIGEHTDYNDGFCLPMAIEADVRILFTARSDTTVRLVSLQQKAPVRFEISREIAKADHAEDRWSDYVRGCAQMLALEDVQLRGVDCVISGNVPLGSGLSSSAALEVASMHALLLAAGKNFPGERIARLAQRAENLYVGNNCGILDQLSSACAVRGQAMLMDCRTLDLYPSKLPPGVSVVISDTGKRRGLVDSAYNERRRQCEAGAKALGVSHLRDATLHGLWRAAADGAIDAQTRRRCEHVIAENGRTLAAFACLQSGDGVAFGALMDQSHADLRDKFEVSCAELDDMAELARSLRGCLGSRMTGAGFGGCVVSLVRDADVEGFVPALVSGYRRKHQVTADIQVTHAAAGAGPVNI